jgi:hypothetical protein
MIKQIQRILNQKTTREYKNSKLDKKIRQYIVVRDLRVKIVI